MFAIPGFIPDVELKLTMVELLRVVDKFSEAILMGQGCLAEIPSSSEHSSQVKYVLAGSLAGTKRFDEAVDMAKGISDGGLKNDVLQMLQYSNDSEKVRIMREFPELLRGS